jgi:lipase maturation factor 1
MFHTESYTLAVSLFLRLLGCIYFFAIGSFIFQIKGLIGRNGILPATDYLKAIHQHYGYRGYFHVPSVFWINSSNAALLVLTFIGTALSVCLVAGIYVPLTIFLLYVIYLSIVSVGQEFLSFGWEGFLLEITIHAFFLSLTSIPNSMIWVSINLLLFRFHFQAGSVKLQSRDPSWKDFTAIAFHYETQPLPNTVAWYIHKLPIRIHECSTLLMFLIELIVPFGIFLTEEIRFVTFLAFAGLQFFIWFTGNFSFLNHLTLALSIILLSNPYLSFIMTPLPTVPSPDWLTISLSLAGGALISLQILRLIYQFIPIQLLSRLFNLISPFYLVNRYGIFAVMTTTRYEIVIEGSHDGHRWEEYLFYYKPSEITRRPRRISPYQPRLDWQVWFLPFSRYHSERWFQSFLYHLLKGTPDVLKLLRHNPFSSDPPKYLRVLMYVYEFSSFDEKKRKGCWWKRAYIEQYTPTLSLR